MDLSKMPSFEGPELPYAAVRVGGRVLNMFPSGTAFVALPHAALALVGSGGRVSRDLVSRWDKHASALLMTVAAILTFLAFRRWGDGPALTATAALNLASPVPSNAAQSLWSFTGEIFCISLALYFALGRRMRPGLSGLAMAFAFACRPTAIVGALTVGVALFLTDRRGAARYVAALGAVVAGICALQFAVYGHPLGAYGSLNTAAGAFNTKIFSGVLASFLSPSRGILIFSPWVLLLPLAPAASRTRPDLRVWVIAAGCAGLISILLAATHVIWWGGWSLGPRLATEAAPFLALAALPLASSHTRFVRPVFLTLLAAAAISQLLLAYSPAAWEWNAVVLDRVGVGALWRWRDSQLAVAWGAPYRVGPAPPATTPGGERLGCSIDLPPEGAKVKGRLNVEGWARIPGADLDVTIYLDGIARAPLSSTRRDRSDVCEALPALGDCSRAGYVVVFEFQPGDAGPHEIHAVVRAPDGRVRRYGVRSFVWSKD